MKRISAEYRITVATLLILWGLVVSTISFATDTFNADSSIVIGVFGFASALLGLGLMFKKKENISEGPSMVDEEK